VTVRLGAFALDSDRRQLTRDDVEIHLTPKAFDLLALLADEAPRVVRKTKNFDGHWRVVTPHGHRINSAMKLGITPISVARTEPARRAQRIASLQAKRMPCRFRMKLCSSE